MPYSFRGSLLGEEEIAAVARVVETGATLTGGPEVEGFEREFCEATGAAHAFATSSCTSALFIAQQLAGLGPGTELIAPPLSFVASTMPAFHLGASVVFADVDAHTLNLDPDSVRERITPATRGIVVVHYAGQMADMEALTRLASEHGIPLIEDAAHAVGARLHGRAAGAWGDFGTFSFHSLKNMSTLGEGGMLTVRSTEHAASVKPLRSMGLVPPKEQGDDYWLPYHYDVIAPGGLLPWNARMGEAAAAVGRVQLRRLGGFNARRAEIASRLNEGLRDLPALLTPESRPGSEPAWHLYTLLLAEGGATERDAFVRELYRTHRVQPVLHYLPTSRFQLYRERGCGESDCPVAESAWTRLLNLPLHPALREDQIDHLVSAVRASAETLWSAGS